jgi:hypothetical protein
MFIKDFALTERAILLEEKNRRQKFFYLWKMAVPIPGISYSVFIALGFFPKEK